MKRIFYPYTIGSDSPIPNLFENIGGDVADSDYEITILSNRRNGIMNHPRIVERYAGEPGSVKRRLRYLKSCLEKHDLIHTGGLAHYKISQISHLRNRSLHHLHTFRVDVNSQTFPTERKRKLLELTDHVSAVSKHTASTVKEAYDVDAEVIYNGVDTEEFHPHHPAPSDIVSESDEKPTFMFVGNFVNRKRPNHVIDVAREVKDARFLLFGDGPMFDSVKRSADELDNVTVVGRVEKSKLPAIYANCTGLLFPSVREGCANVVLEAMASGKPVVGYDATSMPELVTHRRTGWLADRDDVDGLIEGVRHVMAEDADTMAERTRRYVEENHRFDRIADQYIDLYERMMEST
ncbi:MULTISPECIES: glycosyltransferase family 4 protein [unclassified Haladaptatus]|uniref:glycosyltransferase family 4 protein n=1 Tax=unclassified Haladaptatus TaxID=2622732 RepID=UPI00209BCBDB|nr:MULTISPECIES: glycosyltransferase family 4 protein [unclassified Haladaptatus]MCO8244769.1 glycosyltransferase family 4 protein [Haladaptatus sp. AB643]MCO8255719.1 glycosyltransferase family 4 protein [Haladaptatus sp. AB618]